MRRLSINNTGSSAATIGIVDEGVELSSGHFSSNSLVAFNPKTIIEDEHGLMEYHENIWPQNEKKSSGGHCRLINYPPHKRLPAQRADLV